MTTHTIGEVLNRLKDEFDDITISKIRFLEAEGLISPDRTESGYRQFSPADIDRLRYVLRAQRDRYLPLKVIKEELERLDAGLPVSAPADDAQAAGTAPLDGEPAVLLDADDEAAEVALSATQLAQATGLTEVDVAGLRDHGLIGDEPHDGDDVRVATLAADLLRDGVEVRHLRMYKQFADREAAFAEQLVAPLLRQRNPDSRRTAAEQAEHLAAAGGALHRALLGKQLRSMLRS